MVNKKIERGHLGELLVEKRLIENDFNVFKPVLENGKIDIIAEKDGRLIRIQIKTVIDEVRKGKITGRYIPMRKLNHNKTSRKTYLYTEKDIDYFVGSDVETDDIYMIPISVSSMYKSAINIKTVAKFKNNFNI